MKITNSQLVRDAAFSDAFKRLSKAVDLPAREKLSLVKLRKDISGHLVDVQETLVGYDNLQAIELLKMTVEFDFNPIEVGLVVDILSADDILIMSETILKESL